jgi:ribosomal protein L32E
MSVIRLKHFAYILPYRGTNMVKDLFQISTERDIYSTMDLWAMLSPRLYRRENKSFKNQGSHRFKKTTVEDWRNEDVGQSR